MSVCCVYVCMYVCVYVCMCVCIRDGTIHDLKVSMHCPKNITMHRCTIHKQTKYLPFSNFVAIIWLKTGIYISQLYTQHSYVCSIYVDTPDILRYTICRYVESCIDSCITLLRIAIHRCIDISSHL